MQLLVSIRQTAGKAFKRYAHSLPGAARGRQDTKLPDILYFCRAQAWPEPSCGGRSYVTFAYCVETAKDTAIW